jgi:hypothetical protein
MENIQDMIRKGRVARGDQTNHNKLTAEQVLEIRREDSERPPDMSRYRLCKDLAARYNMRADTFWRILSGKKWKYLLISHQLASKSQSKDMPSPSQSA